MIEILIITSMKGCNYFIDNVTSCFTLAKYRHGYQKCILNSSIRMFFLKDISKIFN